MAGQLASAPVRLIPLLCTRCNTPIPAIPGEVAWACPQCQQGLALDIERGLAPIEIYYHGDVQPGSAGKPYWIANGRVQLQRETFGGGKQNAQAAEFWQSPRLFTIPAYAILADALAETGPRLLLQPPVLKAGPFSAFAPVTLASADLQSIAIFIVSSIESSRKDKLKRVHINVELGPAQLWVLPS